MDYVFGIDLQRPHHEVYSFSTLVLSLEVLIVSLMAGIMRLLIWAIKGTEYGGIGPILCNILSSMHNCFAVLESKNMYLFPDN